MKIKIIILGFIFLSNTSHLLYSQKFYSQKTPKKVMKFFEDAQEAEKQGETEKALKYYQEAIALCIKKTGKEHPSYVSLLGHLARFYLKENNTKNMISIT